MTHVQKKAKKTQSRRCLRTNVRSAFGASASKTAPVSSTCPWWALCCRPWFPTSANQRTHGVPVVWVTKRLVLVGAKSPTPKRVPPQAEAHRPMPRCTSPHSDSCRKGTRLVGQVVCMTSPERTGGGTQTHFFRFFRF